MAQVAEPDERVRHFPVAGDLLAVYQEAFAAALKEVEGRVQYVVKGRYVEQAVLAEALAEIPEAARLPQRTLRPPT